MSKSLYIQGEHLIESGYTFSSPVTKIKVFSNVEIKINWFFPELCEEQSKHITPIKITFPANRLAGAISVFSTGSRKLFNDREISVTLGRELIECSN